MAVTAGSSGGTPERPETQGRGAEVTLENHGEKTLERVTHAPDVAGVPGTPSAVWRRPISALLDLPRPSCSTVHRRVNQALFAVYLLACVVCAALVGNAALNDWQIAQDRGTATAEVLSTGSRTLVRFPDDEGRYHSPSTGLKYPGGLSAGERVQVEYQRDDPDNVKVAGRAWTLALLPAISTWVVCTVVAVVLFGAVRWWFRR